MVVANLSKRVLGVRDMVDANTFDEICSFVQARRPRALTAEERLVILRAAVYCRFVKANDGNDSDVTLEVARLFGRCRNAVQAAWRDYITSRDIVVARLPSNTAAKTTRIPRTIDVFASVQKFARHKRQIRARVVAKDVTAFLVETNALVYDTSNMTEQRTALLLVQKFLKHCGYRRGIKSGTNSLALTERNTILRDCYVRFMCETTQHVNPQYRRTVVYLDECFIHHHYNNLEISLYGPTDDLDTQPKAKHKGQRYCIVAAIVDGGPNGSALLRFNKFVGGKQTRHIRPYLFR